MHNKEENVSIMGSIIVLLISINALILQTAFVYNCNWYWYLSVTLPLLLFAILNGIYKKDTASDSILKTCNKRAEKPIKTMPGRNNKRMRQFTNDRCRFN